MLEICWATSFVASEVIRLDHLEFTGLGAARVSFDGFGWVLVN